MTSEICLLEHLQKLGNKTAKNLFKMAKEGVSEILPDTPRLIFPIYRGKGDLENFSIRVSEQEARFAFCQVLEKQKDYYYAIECPTKGLYSFSGSHRLSAQSDVCIYNKGLKRLATVEFKAHMKGRTFAKDIEKIVNEPFTGYWFHLLKNADSGTLKALYGHLINGFKKTIENTRSDTEYKRKSILVTVCILEKTKVHHFILSGKEPHDFHTSAKDIWPLETNIG